MLDAPDRGTATVRSLCIRKPKVHVLGMKGDEVVMVEYTYYVVTAR